MLLTIPRIKNGAFTTARIQATICRGAVDVLSIIDERKQLATYLVEEFPVDEDFGGRGFTLEKLDGERYHCHVAERPEDCSCSCAGGIYVGNCKHVWALKEFVAGRLEEVRCPF